MATEETKVEETKTKKAVWKIECMMCGTSAGLQPQKISGKASFIVVPRIICGKCKSVCTVQLIEDGNLVYG